MASKKALKLEVTFQVHKGKICQNKANSEY